MKSEPFISVIVPTYNRAHLITPTLESLLQQDYTHYEVIVVDDGSTDNTEEVVQAIHDERLRYFKKDNAERAAARNYGAQRAKGDYINFFDSDDIALPNHLNEAVNMIINKDTPEWFHLGYAWATSEHVIFKKIDHYKSGTSNHLLPYGNPVGTATVFIRKDIALSNPFDEDRDLSASEDYELWFRLASQYPFYYKNQITSLLIHHPNRSVVTSSAEKLSIRIFRLLDKIMSNSMINAVYEKKLYLVKMELYSYLALHLSEIPNEKLLSFHYLMKAFFVSPRILFCRRFYSSIRNLFTISHAQKLKSH